LLALRQRNLAELRSRLTTPGIRTQQEAAETQIKEAERQLAALPAPQMVYAATTIFTPQGTFQPTQGIPRQVSVLRRGSVMEPIKLAVPGTLPLSHQQSFVFDLPPDHDESDRRTALARWITDRENPLTWRSIVNRVWHYHFGQGIVSTPNDFGRMGALPTHPELLDWLACEFRDGDQSLKELHRLIVTSSVYRQSSQHDERMAAIDGSNQRLWRMNRRRLDAESVRDSILAVSGALDTTMGGPGYYLFELEKPEHSPHYEYHKFDPADPTTHRRTVYRFVVRSQPNPWMTTLDCADSSQSTPKRDETLTSLQALALLNNGFILEMAGKFATRLQQEEAPLPDQVDRAMALVAQRSLERAERDVLVAYAESHGIVNLCRFLFNLSEFIYLD
jgi:hypothetical protein